MANPIIDALASELERLLPLVKALAEVETKGRVAQKLLSETMAKQTKAEADAESARRASADAIARAQENLQARTVAFKDDLVVRHREASKDYEDFVATTKATKARELKESAERTRLLDELQRKIALAQQELASVDSRLATARGAFKKALAGVGA